MLKFNKILSKCIYGRSLLITENFIKDFANLLNCWTDLDRIFTVKFIKSNSRDSSFRKIKQTMLNSTGEVKAPDVVSKIIACRDKIQYLLILDTYFNKIPTYFELDTPLFKILFLNTN